jgi:O-antigen/teichoic acid export membrane protein
MKKNFSANLLFLLVLNLLIKPVYVFGIEVGIQNEVGPSEYGLYYAMFNFTFLFNVLLDMGINNFQKIKVAENSDAGMKNMATLLPLKLGLAVLYMGVTVTVAFLFGFEERYWYFIGWLMLNHVLMAFLLLLRANLSGLHLFVRDSIVSVIDRLFLVLALGYVLLYGSETFKIESFVLYQTLAYIIAISFAMLMTPKNSRFPKLNFKLSSAGDMIKQTWPFALLILLMTAYSRLDGIMIERLAVDGLKEAGIYAQAYRIIDAGNSFAFLYAGMLLPIFSRLIIKKDQVSISTLMNQGARFLIAPAGIAAFIALHHADWFMALMYDQEIAKSAMAFEWLMGSFLFICIGYIFGTFVTAAGKLNLLNGIAALAVLINVVLNLFLIPQYGAEGAAIASFFSLGVMALSQVIVVYRSKNEISMGWLWRVILCWVAVIGTAIVVGSFVSGETAQLLWISVAGVISFVLIALKRSDLKTVIPSEEEQ